MKYDLPPRKSIPVSTEQTGTSSIYLHLGENPFAPTDHVQKAICNSAASVHRYPDTNARQLREKLADYVGHGITADNIIVGNGSDELIDLAVLALTDIEQPVATFEPTFFVYGFCAKRHGRPLKYMQRLDDYTLPVSIEDQQHESQNAALYFLANPNNPTGTLTSRENLVALLDRLPGTVVVDECYYEFCGETVVDLVHHYPNLVVLRSLSKNFALAGLRIGYAIGSTPVIDAMLRHALVFPVNAVAQAAGLAALEDIQTYQSRIATLKMERDSLKTELENLGFQVLPSWTNFIMVLFESEEKMAAIRDGFKEHSILVSDQSNTMKRPALRIAVGTHEENERLVQITHSILG